MQNYFFVFKRNLKSGKQVYYYQTYNPDGSFTSAKSTGCKTRTAAIHYCEKLLIKNNTLSSSDILFSNYAEHFFDIDSVWVQDKLASGTTEHPAISPLYIKKLQSTVRLHLLPYFSNKQLSTIKPTDVKKFRIHLLEEKKLSFKSVNNILSVFKIIFDVAQSDDVLTSSPLRGIKPLMKLPSLRNAFTLEDAKKVLCDCHWGNQSQRSFNFVAALTGLRLSEINALRKENIFATYIDLKDQYLRGELRPLKTKQARKIPICPELFKFFSERIEHSPDGFVFYDVGATKASDSLRKVLNENIPERKKECGYCFHSWRHFYNTYLLSNNINPIKVAAVLGHSTGVGSVQERYTNFTDGDYKEIYDIQSQLFNELKFW